MRIQPLRVRSRRGRPRPEAVAALAVLLVCALPAGLAAWMPGAPPWKASLSLGGGLFYATQADLRTLYGQFSYPLHVQFDLRIGGPISIFAGYRHLAANGSTVVVEPVVFEEQRYGIRLAVRSVRAGFRLDSALGSSRIFIEVGGSYNFYEESWDGADVAEDGRTAGFLLAAGFELPLTKALALQTRLEYATIPTAKGGVLDPDVDLGGADAVLGIVFRFGRR